MRSSFAVNRCTELGSTGPAPALVPGADPPVPAPVPVSGVPPVLPRRRPATPSGWPASCRTRVGLVAVVVRLVRALDGHTDVLGLVLAELGEADAQRVEVQARDLLVEVLRQDVDAQRVPVGLREQLD